MSGPWVQIHTGRSLNLVAPDPSSIDIQDIALSLSRLPRFLGHTRAFYSNAQHCLLVSQAVEPLGPAIALQGLLHDAYKAYLGDFPAPLLSMPELDGFGLVKARVAAAIHERFGLPPNLDPAIKIADLRMLATEKRDLIAVDLPWDLPESPYPETIAVLTEVSSRTRFLERFVQLKNLL
jgi:hypothetical protein